MLAIIFFTVFFALGISKLGERGKPVIAFFDATAQAMFNVVNMIMKFAPFGVFALIGVTVSKFGFDSLMSLGKLIILVYAALIFFLIALACLQYIKFRNSTSKNYEKDGGDWLSKIYRFFRNSNWIHV
jgi:Na+/H+-dicarboxylate symporter